MFVGIGLVLLRNTKSMVPPVIVTSPSTTIAADSDTPKPARFDAILIVPEFIRPPRNVTTLSSGPIEMIPPGPLVTLFSNTTVVWSPDTTIAPGKKTEVPAGS